MNPCRYYVAVDFGSESMAACYIEEHLLEPRNIDLQAQGRRVTPGFEPLCEDDGTDSKRLRTRIALTSKTQTVDDARLQHQIAAPLDQSDFAYYHEPYQEYVRDLLPNLKLLYQAAVVELLPSNARTATPERILATVVLQILNEIVFKDAAFLTYAQTHSGGLRGSMVELLLTIPNVYSISHASKLRTFIGENLQVGGEKVRLVDTIYESDAIAHYLMWKRTPPPPSMAATIHKITSAAEKGKRCNLATIDIGRGTTDVSFCTFENRDGLWQYDLKARTGRAHGGGRLSYLIAETIEEELDDAFAAVAKGAPDDSTKAALKNHHLRLIKRTIAGMRQDATIISVAERYIEAVKQHWDENLQLQDADEVYQEIEPILDQFADIAKNDIPTDILNALLPKLRTAFTVPRSLPGAAVPTFVSTLFRSKKREPAGSRGFVALRGRVEQYIKANTDDVIGWMEEMVRWNEEQPRSTFSSLLRGTETVILIAGRASQFRPLREALKQRIGSPWNVDVEPGGNVLFLDGAEAKYACSHGAVMRHRLPIENVRPNRIMGTYGFLSQAINGDLRLVDIKKFQVEQQRQTVPLTKRAFHSFVYAPRHFGGSAVKGPQLDAILADGAAFAYLWPIPHGGNVDVTNLGDGGIQLQYENDAQQVTVVRDDAAFGDVQTPEEDIYTRTWPEVLEPIKEEGV